VGRLGEGQDGEGGDGVGWEWGRGGVGKGMEWGGVGMGPGWGGNGAGVGWGGKKDGSSGMLIVLGTCICNDPSRKCIMASIAPVGITSSQWSNCSQSDMEASFVLYPASMSCLYNEPAEAPYIPSYTGHGMLTGLSSHYGGQWPNIIS
jgi:hypothetical protein